MIAHRIELTLQKDGTVTIDNLPFHAGETVEIIVLAAPTQADWHQKYSLQGTPVSYERPYEPVASDEWDAT